MLNIIRMRKEWNIKSLYLISTAIDEYPPFIVFGIDVKKKNYYVK